MTTEADVPTPACPVCHRHGPTWAVCERCLLDVHWRLGDILALHLQCQRPAASRPPYGGGDGLGPVGGSHDLPMAADADIMDLQLGEVLLVGLVDLDTGESLCMGLEDWARDWRGWLGHSPHGLATQDSSRLGVVEGVIRYLTAQWPTMAQAADQGGHPAVDEFAADVQRLHGWAMSALRVTRFDRDPSMTREPPAFAIPCPGDSGSGSCGHRLDVHRQPLDVDGRAPEPVRLNCPSCGTHWDLDRLRLVAVAAGTRPRLTREEALDRKSVV